MEKRSTEDQAFWMEVRALLISLVCLIEKRKLGDLIRHTTAELRERSRRARRAGSNEE